MTPLAIIILAAGKSSRMKSATSKVLHKVAGWSVLHHVLNVGLSLEPERVILVTSPDAEDILAEARCYASHLYHAVQPIAAGTGDAVRAAMPYLEGFSGRVLILYGDSPLMTKTTLNTLLQKLPANDMALIAMQPTDPAHYGRVICNEHQNVEAIIEYNDATQEEREISLCNSGVMAFNSAILPDLLARLTNNNAKEEFYLTDTVALVVSDGKQCAYVLAGEQETLGINTRFELAQAEAIMQARLRNAALDAGVSMIAPETVFLGMDTHFGVDVLIHPNVVIGAGVTIEDYAEIRSFSHIEGAEIGEHTTIGPFARLRKGTKMKKQSAVGNFVEVKNTTLHEGVKAGHLSYLGDSEIGEHSNIGAGTITCNYDGANKHHTKIGANVFIGSNTALVAPVTIGSGATVAAGSVITQNVDDNSLAIGRCRQIDKKDWKTKSTVT